MGHAGYGAVCAKKQTGTNSHSISSESPFLNPDPMVVVQPQHKAVVTLASAHIISVPVLPPTRHPVTGVLHSSTLYTGEEKGHRQAPTVPREYFLCRGMLRHASSHWWEVTQFSKSFNGGKAQQQTQRNASDDTLQRWAQQNHLHVM